MIKKVISGVVLSSLIASSLGLSQVSAANSNILFDVPDDGLKTHIETMVNEGIMTVYKDGSFKPQENVDRKKAARYIYNALKAKTALINNNVDVTVAPFADVPANDFYTKFISEMKRLGIMNGYSDGLFGYNNKLSRGEELAIILKAKSLADPDFVIPDYKNYPQLIQSSHRFSDVNADNTFFNVIYTALDNGYISPNDTFKTNSTITKAETAKLINNILWQTLVKLDNKAKVTTDETTTEKVSPFYKGDYVSVDSSVNYNADKNRLELTIISPETNGKIPYISKDLLEVSNGSYEDLKMFNIDKITLISQGNDTYVYGVYVNEDLSDESTVNVYLSDQNIGLDATYTATVETNIDNVDGNTDETVTTDETTDTTENTDATDTTDGTTDETVTTDETTDTTDETTTTDEVVVKDVSVTVVDSVIEGDSIPDAIAVPVFGMDVVNNGSEEIKFSSIKVKVEGFTLNDEIDSVAFYDGDIKISNNRTINSDDTATLRIDNDFVIPAGETKRLMLRANIKSGASNNGKFAFHIESSDDIVLNGDGGKVEGDYPLIGESLDIVNSDIATIEIQNGDTPTVINIGETAATVAGFYIVNSSSKTLKMKKITLHNNGDFSEKYFANMKLVDSNDSNKVLATDPYISGSDITFLLDDDLVLEEGTTKSLEVLADITDDKGAKIEFYLKDQDDLLVYQNFGALNFAVKVDFTKFDVDTVDHNIISVEGGNVTASEGDDNDEDIAQGDRNITLGKLNLTSTDEDVYVENLRFKLDGTHNGTTITDANYAANFADWADKLSNLKIIDLETNKVISDTMSFNNSERELSFGINNFDFGPTSGKTTRKLAIIGNLNSDSTTGDTFIFNFMNEVKTDIFEIYSKFDDDLIEQVNVTPSNDIQLSTKTVTSSELTVQLSSNKYTDTIIKGAEQVDVISFLFKANTKDAKLKDLKITIEDASGTDNTSSVLETFQNVGLFIGDTQIGSTENVIETNKYEGTVLFDNIDHVIPKDTDVVVTVRADVNSNASENDDFLVKIKDASDVNAIDNNNIAASITDGDAVWDNPNQTLYKNTIKDKGVVAITASIDSPKDSLFIPSDDYTTVYKADIRVENEKAKVKTVKFIFGASSTTDGIVNVESGKLYINGKDTGLDGSFGSNGISFEFDNNDGVNIEKNISSTIELKIKSKSGNDFKRGGVVSFELDSTADALEFDGDQSKDTLTYNMTGIAGSGSDFRYYYATPAFDKIDDTDYTDVIPSSDQVLLVAKVKNNGMARVLLESIAIKKTGNPTITNLRAYMSSTGPSTSEQDKVTDTANYLAFDLGTAVKSLKLTKNSTSGEVLDNGEYKYITIVGDLNNSLKGNALSISIEPSTVNGDFVWHDNEATNTNTSNDNLYIENLPLSKSWINTQDPVTVGADTVAPTILSASYLDTDDNATVDRVVVTLGEAIEGDNVTDFRITDGTDTFRPTEMVVAGSNITLTKFQIDNAGTWEDVSSTTDKYLVNGTGGSYSVYYQNSYSGNPVKDLAGNFLVNVDSGSAISITDNAAPILLTSAITDAQTDGIFTTDEAGDKLTLTFSEDIASLTFADFKASIEVEENGGGNDFSADVNSVFNDDLVAATTDVVSSGNTIVITSDGTNTASSPMITSGDSQIRLKAAQTAIKDASGNTGLTGQAVTNN